MKSKDLKSLNLDIRNISTEFRADIAKFKNLEDLNLSKVKCLSDSDFIKITRECKQLKTFHLEDLENISSSALETIGQLRNLECLYLPEKVNDQDDQVIISIANQCANLTDLSKHFYVTVVALRELGNLINLKRLFLCEVIDVDDTAVMSIANNCFKLESLYIRIAQDVTDSSIMALIKNCPLLGDLSVHESKITVGSLICAVQETKRRQKNLNFSGCSYEIVEVFHDLDIESPFLQVFPCKFLFHSF